MPPTERLTSEVAPVSAPSWLAVTSVVLAPEQAAKTKLDGPCAFAHSCGYAFVLRRQLPLAVV